ncbi:hypothetical protein [Kitasatospora sp. NBC_00315]|uniref:hypothetical protein n=1 Tax=Kitasatospora sp. NBC_00315 TaxID=2975963 RepID=UPI003248B3A9
MTPELKAAVAFLMELPKPFACGLRHARRFAPKLLTAMAFLGWEEPDEYLAMELVAKSADGLADPPAAIGVRIEDLRPRHIVVRDRAKPAPQTPPQAPCPTHPGLEAAGCPQCAAADAMDRQRRELDAAKGIDDESARKALEAMLANRGPQSRAARGREHAARQGAQAREEASKRDAYLRELEALSG